MTRIFKLLKPFDYVFILLAILISFTPMLVTRFMLTQDTEDATLEAIVKIDGEEYIIVKQDDILAIVE